MYEVYKHFSGHNPRSTGEGELLASWFKHNPPNFVSHECRMQYCTRNSSNVTFFEVFGIMLTSINSWKGWHSQFLVVAELGLALAPKMCLDQSQALEEINNSQVCTVGREQNDQYIFFWTSRFQVFRGMFVQTSKLLIQRTDCVRT